MQFRRPIPLPGEHSMGRLTTRQPLRVGDPCRWCKGVLKSLLSKHLEIFIRCSTCDGPIQGDNTVRKAE